MRRSTPCLCLGGRRAMGRSATFVVMAAPSQWTRGVPPTRGGTRGRSSWRPARSAGLIQVLVRRGDRVRQRLRRRLLAVDRLGQRLAQRALVDDAPVLGLRQGRAAALLVVG